MTDRPERRRFLQSGSAVALAALAGCLGGDDGSDGNTADPDNVTEDGTDSGTDTDDSDTDDGNGRPPVAGVTSYSGFVGADSDDEATTAYVDQTAVSAVDSVFDDSAVEGSDDPLLLLPVTGLTVLTLVGQVAASAGLGSLLDPGTDQFDSGVDERILSGQALVLTGDIDTGEIDESLTASAGGPLSTFEQVDSTGPYDIYQLPERDGTRPGDRSVAVSGADIVVGGTRSAVDRVLGTVTGARPPATESFEPFEWVLENAGDHDIAFASHGDTPDDVAGGDQFGLLADAVSFAAGHTIRDGQLDAAAAVVYESASMLAERESEIAATFGSDAADSSLSFDGDRVTVSGTYTGALGGE